ncbi:MULTISPECIES: GlsB/YeaQ/YmgE family stress response membrane protein [unclassified Thioalkalivibrio]|uniref:GlsB/YeaQ/YmgE family stress response membrane protein n=1 Tax=unclassified Thioalkalivibrio TaxID=2621013 RepID=UPI00035F097D|nr:MULTISPECIES: GlsB/YeaQ/YmgE family stress response membrane protein [unclassified Thioalkalivibrio]
MPVESLLLLLLIGGIAGWLAGLLVHGAGQGILLNIVIGVIGAVLGGWLFTQLGVPTAGLVGTLVAATVGAILLLALLRLIAPRKW